MPFQTRQLSTLPTRTPDVEIIFHGQLFLRSEDGRICEVGVNPIATDHELLIEVRTKTPGGRPDQINMRHVGPLDFRSPEGMSIELVPPADTLAAWKCVTTDAIDRHTGDGSTNDDFRWMLNLEGNLFHNKDLHPVVFGTQNTIKLHQGEYFFRTGVRAPDRLRYERRGGGLGNEDFKRIGAIARASLFLVQNQSLVIRWTEGTEPRTLTLTKSSDNTTYEVYIENTPKFVVVPNPSDLSAFEELVHFYKVIPTAEVSPAAKFTLKPVDVPAGQTGSPTIPCQVMTLDGPGGD